MPTPVSTPRPSTPIIVSDQTPPPPQRSRSASESGAGPDLPRAPSVSDGSSALQRRTPAPAHQRQATSLEDLRPGHGPEPVATTPLKAPGGDNRDTLDVAHTPPSQPAGRPAATATPATHEAAPLAADHDLAITPVQQGDTSVTRRRAPSSRASSVPEQQQLQQELMARAQVVAGVLVNALMMHEKDTPPTKKEKRDKLTDTEINAPDVQQRLMDVAMVLAQELSIPASGFSSMNEAVEAAARRYLKGARKSDVAIATLVTGIMKGIGYLIGMTDSNERAVEKMFKDHLDNAHTLGTFVGHYVAVYDIPLGLLGMGVAAGLHHVGTDSDLPESLQKKINAAQDHIDDVRDAGAANLAKNSPRLVEPVIQSLIENGRKLGPISRKAADRADLSGIDGGGGVLASMRVEYGKLNRRYDQRLILNKPDNVRHSVRRIEGKETASAKRVASSLLATVKAAPLTYLMLMLMVGPFIGRLFGANASIERDMGHGNNNGLPPDKVALGLVTSKRAGSTFDMFTMVTFLNYWAPVMAQMEGRMWEKAGNHPAVKKFTDLLPDWGGSQVSLQRNLPTLTEA